MSSILFRGESRKKVLLAIEAFKFGFPFFDIAVGTITFNNEKLSYDNDSIYLDIDVFINDVISKNEVVSFGCLKTLCM